MDLKPSALLNGFLTKSTKVFQIQNIQVGEGEKPKGFLHHEGFGNNESVDLISLRFADVVAPHGRRFERVNHAHIKRFSNKVSNKVVAVVRRRFKTNDELILGKRFQFRDEHLEAIKVIQEFKRLNEYLAIRGDGRSKMV